MILLERCSHYHSGATLLEEAFTLLPASSTAKCAVCNIYHNVLDSAQPF